MAAALARFRLPSAAFHWPLVGETVSFGRNPQRFVLERAARFGPIFESHVLGRRTVFMVGAEALRFVLCTHRDRFAAGPGWPRGLQALMRGALMMLDGPAHDEARRRLARAFAPAAIAGYLPVIDLTTRHHLAAWARRGRLRLYDGLKRLTFDVAAQLLLGATAGGDVARVARLFATYTRGMEGLHPLVPLRLPFLPFGRAFAARDRLLAYVAAAAERRRRAPGDDALSLLVRDDDLSAAEVAGHALFLLFAGHESTASLVASACLELARHPGLLARARDEQERHAGAAPAATLDALPFLDAVLLETERRWPPFSGSFRHARAAFDFAGHHVAADTRVFVSINGTHHDLRVFARPDAFDPDRFADPEVTQTLRRQLQLAGFGGGPRTCLGMGLARAEAKLILSHLLRGYEWTPAPAQRLDPLYLPSLAPKDGLRVRFVARAPGSRC